MKRFLLPLLVFFILICNSAFLGAFELEVLGGFNGFSFNPYKTDAYSEPDTDKEFTFYPYWLGNINFRQNISEILNFYVNIERDNVLQNSLSALFGAKTDYINVKFGVFMGLTNEFTIPDAGIIGNLELILDKTLFLSLSGSSTLGTPYGFTSNNSRETAGIKLGTWTGSIIPSISADLKSLSKQGENDVFTDDTLYRFLVNLDFLLKNSNVTGYVNGGYQVYSRVIKKETLEFTDSLSTYLAGFGLYWHGKPLGFKIGAEVPFLISSKSTMAISNKYLFFSKVYVGFVYTFEKKENYDRN
jgi:hypothetical protein